jgi:hypothetical protein
LLSRAFFAVEALAFRTLAALDLVAELGGTAARTYQARVGKITGGVAAERIFYNSPGERAASVIL